MVRSVPRDGEQLVEVIAKHAVEVPVSQLLEENVEVKSMSLQECGQQRIDEHFVDVLARREASSPQVTQQFVEGLNAGRRLSQKMTGRRLDAGRRLSLRITGRGVNAGWRLCPRVASACERGQTIRVGVESLAL